MSYLDKTVEKLKQAKTDKEIKDILLAVSMDTQWDSDVRAEFDKYQIDQRWIEHVVENLQ